MSTQAHAGTVVAGYRIEELIGRGGMGAVYRAADVRLGRQVALKLIIPELAEDERFRERFLRESRLAASLDHPHVVPIYQAGEDEGRLFLAMRYVEGTDLARVIAEEGPLEPARAVALLEQVGEALDVAHERGLVHRDVKPSNVLIAGVRGREHAYLADFGLTKQASSISGITVPGQILGTLAYVAPELIKGDPVEAPADVYSLGCVLYECLTGTPPHAKASDVAVLWGHVHEDPPPPSGRRPELPRALDAVLARALAKDPARRYPTCGELAADARAALAPAAGRARARLLPIAAAAVLAAAVVAATFLLLRSGSEGLTTVSPNAVGIVDARHNRLVDQVAVGVKPDAVAVGDSGVWIANVSDKTVSRVDPKSRELGRTIAVGDYPSDLAVDSGGAWVAHGPLATLTRISSDRNEPAQPIRALGARGGCGSPEASLAVGADALWFACGSADLAKIDLATLKAVPLGHTLGILTSPSAALPEFSDIAFGLRLVWLTNRGHNTLIGVDSFARRVEKEITLRGAPSAVAVGGGYVWVTMSDRDAVERIEFRDGVPVFEMIAVGDEPVDIAVGEGAVWVANAGDRTVSRIDPRKAEVVATIKLGNTPRRIAAGKGAVWVTVRAA